MATGEIFDPRRLAGQTRDLILGLRGDPKAPSAPASEKPRITLTEGSEIGAHRFEVEELTSRRIMHILQPWWGPEYVISAEEHQDMTPEDIARKFRSNRCDGYYTATRVTGHLIVDGVPVGSGGYFSVDVQKSPTTYLGGQVVDLRNLRNDRGWGKAARSQLDTGYERAVLFECSAARTFDALLYPLKPGDVQVPRPPESIR